MGMKNGEDWNWFPTSLQFRSGDDSSGGDGTFSAGIF